MPAPQLSYPLVNGNRFDFTSIEILIEGIPFRGVKSINYEDGTDGAKQYGTSARPLGRTRGKYDPSGSLEIFKEEANAIRLLLGNGWGEVSLTIVVAYAELAVSVPTVDKLFGCRVRKAADAHSQGAEGLTEKWDLDIMDITRNGVRLLSDIAYVK